MSYIETKLVPHECHVLTSDLGSVQVNVSDNGDFVVSVTRWANAEPLEVRHERATADLAIESWHVHLTAQESSR